MRLYTRINPIASGSTASINNKGFLVINSSTSVAPRPFVVNIINYDGSVTGITCAVGTNTTSLASNQIFPNFSIIPFQIASWSDLSGVTLQGFELF